MSKNLSRIWIGVPSRSTLVQKTWSFYKVFENENPKSLFNMPDTHYIRLEIFITSSF